MTAPITCPNGHPVPSQETACPICGTLAAAEPVPLPVASPPPRVLGYEVLGELGRGGMGVVYKARQHGLARLIALKMISSDAAADPKQRRRFKTEAEAVARLRHPNVVQIHEVGEAEGRPYFSMEFVEDGTLAGQVNGTPQPPRDAALAVETLARAVHAAHERGIVHRDLKPANILLRRKSESPRQLSHFELLISDFGLARVLDADDRHTQTRDVMGTPSYMAPEQATGAREAGPAADVWALGAILYDLLTGRPPFAGATVLETLDLVRSADPVPPRQFQPRLPRDLETICLKCLQKEPRRRYASARDLADDLGRFLAGDPIRARAAGVLAKSWKWVRHHPTRAVALGMGLVLVLIAAAAAWDHQRQRVRALELLLESEDRASTVLLDEGRFVEAQAALREASKRLQGLDTPEKHQLDARQDRVTRLVEFRRLADEAWFQSGEEQYLKARATAERALGQLGVLDDQRRFTADWWRGLPDADLADSRKRALREDVYRLLLLLTQVRTMPWLSLSRAADPAAKEVFGESLAILDQAETLQTEAGLNPALTVRLFRNFLETLRRDGLAGLALKRDPPPALSTPENPIDFFFGGQVHYFLAKSPPNEILKTIMRKVWGGDLDFQTPAATSEQMLATAARLEPDRFWTHFVLGRVMLNNGNDRGAELAFNECVRLRPEFPVSYGLRGLAASRHAAALRPGPNDAALKVIQDHLIQQARQDAQLALERGRNEPAIYWSLGELFDVLGESPRALEMYARGLELEQGLEDKVSRRSVLNQVDEFVARVLKAEPTNAAALALRDALRRKRDGSRGN